MSTFKSAIILECDGETVAELNVPKDFNIKKFDISKLEDEATESIGSGKISRECDFEWEDAVLSVFAFTEGKAGNENKTELPPPIDTQLYFGNIFVLAHKNNRVIDLSLDSYKEFYTTAFGGFEDIGDEDSWSSEEEPTADDLAFIVNDDDEDEDEDEEYVVNEDEEEEDEFSDEEDETEESGDYSLHSDNSSDNEALDLEEADIIDSFCKEKDAKLLKAPFEFKQKVYSYIDSEYDFLLKWTEYNANKDKAYKTWLKWLKTQKS